MSTETMLLVLYAVFIIVGVFLIAVLWRLFDILSNFKEISNILKKRAIEIDESVSKAKNSFTDFVELMKSFIFSMGFVRNIRNSMKNKEKGDDDDKE